MIDRILRWREVIGLVLLSVVFASLQRDTLRELGTSGTPTVGTLYELSLVVLLSIAVIGACYETLQLMTG
jgi:hypothetical protein